MHLTCPNVFKTMHSTLLSLFWLSSLPHAIRLCRFLTPIGERKWTKAINLDLVSMTVNDWYHCGLLWNFKIPHDDNETYRSIHNKANAFIVLKFKLILPYRTFHTERHRRNFSLQPIVSTFWSKTLHQANQIVHTAVTSFHSISEHLLSACHHFTDCKLKEKMYYYTKTTTNLK